MALSLGIGRHVGEHPLVGRERLTPAISPYRWPLNHCHRLASHPGMGAHWRREDPIAR